MKEGEWPKRFIKDIEGNVVEIDPSTNWDDNVPQRVLRDKIEALEQDLGFTLNILHFIITDSKTPISEPLRTKLWGMLDTLFKQQNERG